ncbi:MAG TPA: DHA2 family efflux MFS transporter permease subunit [Candidatus Binataceae bacterium]|jgi:DHA2 family multidrug resistance protein|nr:DHA2 family efflux MFS transporter permease subunit [Candidatus Binataceae bacterium]
MASAPKDNATVLDERANTLVDATPPATPADGPEAGEETIDERAYEHSHKWLIAIAVMLGTMLEMLDTSIINVSLPHMQGAFSASVDEITWVLTSYLLANGIMIPMTGWISSRFGRKRYFLTSVVTFVIASGLCGAARSLDQMVLFRLLQGVAGAAMVPSSQAIMMETFPPQEQAMAMATWGLGIMAAPIIGPTLGGWITDNWSWRWNFYINIPVGAIAVLMVSAFVHDPAFMRKRRASGGKVDYLGIMLLVLGLGSMQIVMDRGQRADWFAAPWVVWMTALAAISLVGLVVRELTFSEPIIDFRILKIPAFTIAVFLVVAMFFVTYGGGVLNPIFLQEYLGYSAMMAGITMAPRGIALVVTLLVVGQLARLHFDTRISVSVGFMLSALGLWQMSHFDLQMGIWNFVMPSVYQGVGAGMIFPTLSAATLSCIARERVGYASSLYSMLRNNFAAISVAYLSTTLVTREEVHQTYLGQHYTVFEAWRMAGPTAGHFGASSHFGEGARRGMEMVYHGIQAQAAMLSFNDLFRILTFIAVILIPGPFLLKRPAAGAQSAGGH